MSEPFVPPYPIPHRSKSRFLMRFIRGWESWLHVLFEKSYTMKLGEVRMPGLHFYVANEASLVARIMDDPALEFPKHGFLKEMLEPLIGNSVFSANGEDWRTQRAMVNPSFAHTALKRTFPLMQAAVDAMVARAAAQDRTRPVHIDPLMTHVAADIIFRTLFSIPLDAAGAERIHTAFNIYQRHAQSASTLRLYRLPMLGYRRRAERAAGEVREVFAPIVRARHAAFETDGDRGPTDILATLLAARHPETGARFTCEQVIEQVATIFLAGHETAASAMTWALYLIAECPHLQVRMRAELADAAGDGPLAYEHLRALTVTRDVFRETLRLYPPVSFFIRSVTKPTRMRDKLLAAGAMLVVSPWLIQRSPNEWKCPHAFDPDRFERPDEQAAVKTAWLPFGRGPRVCVGAGFAQQEALLTLAAMVRRFEIGVVAGDRPEPISRLTLRSKRGVRLMLRERVTG